MDDVGQSQHNPSPEAVLPKEPYNYFGVLFGLLGLVFLVPPITRGGYWWLLAWPAVVLLIVSGGYLFWGPRIFGKQADGTRRWPHRLVMSPYCGGTYLAWRMVRIARRSEPVCNEVAPGVYLGRRAYGRELPEGVGMIVDLTAEFIEPACVRSGRLYRGLPTLDASIPVNDSDVYRLVDEIATYHGGVYIHCAEGHGRAAVISALTIIVRGHATDADDALQQIRAVRPGIKPRPWQYARLVRWAQHYQSQNMA